MTNYLFVGGHLHGQIKNIVFPIHSGIITVSKPSTVESWITPGSPEFETESYQLIEWQFGSMSHTRNIAALAGMASNDIHDYVGKLLAALFDTYVEVNGG